MEFLLYQEQQHAAHSLRTPVLATWSYCCSTIPVLEEEVPIEYISTLLVLIFISAPT